jgi:16S rRNA A1518/A1519 N6-dimethyltransferase RsmA/KsgA/DIM1 with predicted DNA glycosylase/AP lyase activity
VGWYSWEQGGEEWSQPWGNAAFQWAITIYPRLMAALPAARIVEIAPGFGRWTPFLLSQSSLYVGIDISPRCIDFCKCLVEIISSPLSHLQVVLLWDSY